jgi:hypothetical protein
MRVLVLLANCLPHMLLCPPAEQLYISLFNSPIVSLSLPLSSLYPIYYFRQSQELKLAVLTPILPLVRVPVSEP